MSKNVKIIFTWKFKKKCKNEKKNLEDWVNSYYSASPNQTMFSEFDD